MASANDISPEKVSPSNEVASPAESEHEHAAALPTGWMYRDRRVLGLRIPHYASPQIQIILLGFTCFLCPGEWSLDYQFFPSTTHPFPLPFPPTPPGTLAMDDTRAHTV